MKRKWIGLAAALLLAGALAGCKETGSDGLSENELFSLEGEVCTREEAAVFFLGKKAGYEASYGEGIWDAPIGEGTLADRLKEEFEPYVVRIKCAAVMALQKGIVPDEALEQRFVQAAKAYMEVLPTESKEAAGITENGAAAAFRDYYLACAFIDSLETGEISEDEARVVTIQQIFFSTEGLSDEEKAARRALAEEALGRAQAGEDFLMLAGAYGDGGETERSLFRDSVEPLPEEAVFSLSSGQLSGVLETEEGFYLVKCLNNYDAESTAENKSRLEGELKNQEFSRLFRAFPETVSVKYNRAAWEKLELSGVPCGEADFYGIFKEYLGA